MRKLSQNKMSGRDDFKSGDHRVICDYSGFKIHASKAKRTWDGFLVDERFWEARQQQDLVRGVADKIATPPKFTRPEEDNNFLTANEVVGADL